jgi:hypothetical protein
MMSLHALRNVGMFVGYVPVENDMSICTINCFFTIDAVKRVMLHNKPNNNHKP